MTLLLHTFFQQLLTLILAPFAYARNPLITRIKSLGQMPVTFLYGEFDWMERETAEQLVKDKVLNGKVFSVSESGHHLYIENPVECVANILRCTHNEETSNLFISSKIL